MESIMQIEGVHGVSHIALVVPNIETAWNQFLLLGYTERETGIICEEGHGIYAKVINNGPYIIELISPINATEESPYTQFLGQNRYCLDHICYKVDNIESSIEQLKRKHFIPISKPTISKVWNKRVVLIGNRKMGVIELIEDNC